MKLCKVCFTENYFPQPLEDPNLIQFSKTFFKTFGILEDLDERNLFCFVCKSLIWKSYTLMQKAVCGQKALNLLQEKKTVNTGVWQNIRDQYGLFTSLSYHKVEVDYFFTGEDNTDEEEVEIDAIDTEDVFVKQEYFIDTSEEFDENCSSTQQPVGKKRKRHEKRVEAAVKKVKRPYKKKEIIVDTGPRPVDVTADHIIEGKRQGAKKLLKEPELTLSDLEDIPLQQRKKKKKKEDSEQEYDPSDSGSDTDLSTEYYSSLTGKRLKRPVRIYPRRCKLCSSEVQSAKDHYQHYVIHHKETEYPYKQEKDTVCHKCGKLFSHQKRLTDHLRSHTTERTVSCDICKKKFFTMKAMHAHIRLVHVPKKFFCDYCGKGFTTKTNLVLHVRTHTGDKPYSCHICGVRYAHGGNVLVHIRNVHQNQKDSTERKKGKKNKWIKKKAKDISDGKLTKNSSKKETSKQNKKKSKKS